MDPAAYKNILAGSIAGGFAGALVLWNRRRSLIAGRNKPREFSVLGLGTAALICALLAFTRALGMQSPIYAAMVMILLSSSAAVLHSVAPFPIPRFLLRVRAGEFGILRLPGTGVRLFGACLRNTPLRHLGGRVYLSDVAGDPQAVLRGIHSAEIVHIWALALCCPWLIFWAAQGHWRSVGVGVAVHLPLNIYPILHLRYVTWRIERHIAGMRMSYRARETAR